jgi:thiol peroxidase
MVKKRPGLIKFAGAERTVIGDDIEVGQKAPDFTIQKNDLSISKAFKERKRKVRLITSLPSLDTTACDRETRRFNEEAAKLGKNIVNLAVSMDLPAAQKRWCGAAVVDQVMTVSNVFKADFGKKIWYPDGGSSVVAPCGMPPTCPRTVKNRIMKKCWPQQRRPLASKVFIRKAD